MLKEENQRKLAIFRQQLELEHTKEELKAREEHERSLEALRKEFKENEDEEEAILEEKKEDVLRNMRRKVIIGNVVDIAIVKVHLRLHLPLEKWLHYCNVILMEVFIEVVFEDIIISKCKGSVMSFGVN